VYFGSGSDPDSAKSFGSLRIQIRFRIRIRNTGQTAANGSNTDQAPCAGPKKTPARTKTAATATGSSKYGNDRRSFFNLASTGIPEEEARGLEELGSHGLAKKTWSSYTTAERLLTKFHKEKNLQRRLPLSEETTLRFIYWLAKDRNLKANTINSYLAGIRQLHVARGFPDPKIRSDAVNLVLKGLKNKENKDNRKKETDRKPITRDTMALLKSRIRSWKTSPTNQRMVWAVATNLFHGAFRIGELLPAKSSEFDPDFELMTDDVHMTDRSNQFRLKCPKEDRSGKSTIVDVYATGGPFCPVHALRRWRQLIGDWAEKRPAFRWEDRRTFTQNQLGK